MTNGSDSLRKVPKKHSKGFKVKRRKFKKSKKNNPKKNNSKRQTQRIDKKLNVYHILRIFKKYKKLELKKIIIDPSGLKSKVTLLIANQKYFAFDQQNVKYLDETQNISEEIETNQNIARVSIEEADRILTQEKIKKTCLLRSQKRLDSSKEYESLNIFEKKILSMSTKKYKKVQAERKLKNTEEKIKNRKGGVRHREQAICTC